MDDQQIKAYKQAAFRQATLVKKAYRYQDWILVITNAGNYLKVPIGTYITPFPVVMGGPLPNSENILIGIAT